MILFCDAPPEAACCLCVNSGLELQRSKAVRIKNLLSQLIYNKKLQRIFNGITNAYRPKLNTVNHKCCHPKLGIPSAEFSHCNSYHLLVCENKLAKNSVTLQTNIKLSF
ncbi:uncharacterized protein LOC143925433 [Lithobates pipiens]